MKSKFQAVFYLWLSISILAVAGCSGNKDGGTVNTTVPPVEKVKVVVTTPILKDFIDIIGGSYVESYSIVEPGRNVHIYQPNDEDINKISEADMVVQSGAGLEPWLATAVEEAKFKPQVIDASLNVPLLKNPLVGGDDPHIWHSPQNAKLMVDTITRSLIEYDKPHETTYRNTQRSYNAQLDALGLDIRRSLESLKSKKLVGTHYTFTYYAAEYELVFGGGIPEQTSSTTVPPSMVTETVNRLKQSEVLAILCDSTSPISLPETIARDAGIKIAKDNDVIYGDTLGPEGSSAATYLGMQRHNSGVIAKYLK